MNLCHSHKSSCWTCGSGPFNFFLMWKPSYSNWYSKGQMNTGRAKVCTFLFESKESWPLKSHRSSIWSTCLEHWSSTELSCSSNIWGQERWQNFEVRLQDSRYILAVHTCWLSVSLITNDHLNVIMNDGKSNPDVWAIGDAAIIEDAPLPATSQGQYYPW